MGAAATRALQGRRRGLRCRPRLKSPCKSTPSRPQLPAVELELMWLPRRCCTSLAAVAMAAAVVIWTRSRPGSSPTLATTASSPPSWTATRHVRARATTDRSHLTRTRTRSQSSADACGWSLCICVHSCRMCSACLGRLPAGGGRGDRGSGAGARGVAARSRRRRRRAHRAGPGARPVHGGVPNQQSSHGQGGHEEVLIIRLM